MKTIYLKQTNISTISFVKSKNRIMLVKFKCDFSRKYALYMSTLISGRHLVVATGKDVRMFAKFKLVNVCSLMLFEKCECEFM